MQSSVLINGANRKLRHQRPVHGAIGRLAWRRHAHLFSLETNLPSLTVKSVACLSFHHKPEWVRLPGDVSGHISVRVNKWLGEKNCMSGILWLFFNLIKKPIDIRIVPALYHGS